MFKKLKQKLKNSDSTSSSKGLSVKLGTPLGSKRTKINNYIKNKIYKFKLGSLAFSDKYQIKSKLYFVLEWAVNILVTGFAIQYCFENRNALSYGLTTLLFIYYFEKVVVIIKQPIQKNEE
jgi:hypothetical protein